VSLTLKVVILPVQPSLNKQQFSFFIRIHEGDLKCHFRSVYCFVHKSIRISIRPLAQLNTGLDYENR